MIHRRSFITGLVSLMPVRGEVMGEFYGPALWNSEWLTFAEVARKYPPEYLMVSHVFREMFDEVLAGTGMATA